MRVLITGSRDWEGLAAENRIYRVLDVVEQLAYVLGSPLTIVHGDCPTGADPCADRWGRRREPHVTVEPHPADWTKWGKSAGPARNRQMVNLGADMCIAFLKDGSKGTSMVINLAHEVQMPVFVVNWEEGWDATENNPHRRINSGSTGSSKSAA